MVKQLFRRGANLALRLGGVQLARTALRIGQRSALDTALGVATRAVPGSAERLHTQVFNVAGPVTVYVRASHCRVTLREADSPKVTLNATMQRGFGVELAADQDEDGIYIVARRKPVVGTVARVDFTLSVPPDTQLALHLTPGDVVFENINALAELNTTTIYHNYHSSADAANTTNASPPPTR